MLLDQLIECQIIGIAGASRRAGEKLTQHQSLGSIGGDSNCQSGDGGLEQHPFHNVSLEP
jgi:hypothetical protein